MFGLFSRSARYFSRSFGRFSSCSYSDDKPVFSPFFASLFTSSIVISTITSRMNRNQYYLHQQLNDIKKDMEDIKKQGKLYPK